MPIRFSVEEKGTGFASEGNLINLAYRLFDLRPFGERAAKIMRFSNSQGAATGTDRDGVLYQRLAETTWRNRDGGGPPMAPRNLGSTIVTAFQTSVESSGHDEITVRGSWPGVPWIKYHLAGGPKIPRRNFVGIRPFAWDMLNAEFHTWIQETFNATGTGGPFSVQAPPTTSGWQGPGGTGGGKGPGAPPPAPTAPRRPPRTPRPGAGAARAEAQAQEPQRPAPGPPPEIKRDTPIPSSTKYYFSSNEKSEMEAISQFMGRPMTPADVVRLAGVPPDVGKAKVSIEMSEHGYIKINVTSSTVKMDRVIRTEWDSELGRSVTRLENVEIEIPVAFQRQGIGTEVFAGQVKAAAAAGIKDIQAVAGKYIDPDGILGHNMNGYYTWARLGYDGPIPPRTSYKLPGNLSSAKRISDLMKTPEGREWWQQNGEQVNMTFDLREGSLSRRTLDAYVAETAKRRAQRQNP